MGVYQERLQKLNNPEKESVLESIDRPIRPLILELHRIGLPTKFSCCGFPYDKEEEPKSHAKFPFVVLLPLRDGKQVSSFFNFSTVCIATGWKFYQYNVNGEWQAIYMGNSADQFYIEKDGIHNYELNLLAISGIVQEISKVASVDFCQEIIDGNSMGYEQVLGEEWQVKPKKSYKLENVTNDITR